MQKTHGFWANRGARGIRVAATALGAGVILALAMQPTLGGAEDFSLPEPFISALWEHKIEVTVSFQHSHYDLSGDVGKRIENPHAKEWARGELPTVRQAANDAAVWGCGFYNRDAVGPIFQTTEADIAFVNHTLTYACALR